ncbi:MAG: putative addiction module antidote protein [Magnetococcales bacterium]|nr:putative addiction module antidote protein [Magnetococcales bacterium]NGZ26680.1 putative addiction module antidote protein [Magnetococcales bacterium]
MNQSNPDAWREALKDPKHAAVFLNAAYKEGGRGLFLLALRNVAEAQGGMARLASKTGLNRESLYRTLSERGNPRISTLDAILEALGLTSVIQPPETGG